MASKVSKDEDEKDSVTCGICLEFYDTDKHVPKFLQCFHTCCVVCLQSQANNSTSIVCPFCRQKTQVKDGVTSLTTNFYILPQVQKLTAKRKEVESLNAKTKNNLADAINLRREVLTRLKSVHDSIRLLETLVARDTEENNENIVILQSLLEEPSGPKEIDELISSLPALNENFKKSEELQKESKDFAAKVFDVEKFICNLTLNHAADGQKYRVKACSGNPLTFNNTSSEGPCVGAARSLLSYILLQMKKNNQWDRLDRAEESNNEEPASDPVRVSVPSVWISSQQSDTSSNGVQNLCFLRFCCNGFLEPPIVIRLDFEEAPRMSQRFLDLCVGSDEIKYKGTPLFMTKSGDSIAGGKHSDLVNNLVDGLESYGHRDEMMKFIADPSRLEETKGAVRMRHRGRCAEGVFCSSEFSILCRDHQNQNPMTTVFGYVIQGIEVCLQISHMNLDIDDVYIYSCGVWEPEE